MKWKIVSVLATFTNILTLPPPSQPSPEPELEEKLFTILDLQANMALLDAKKLPNSKFEGSFSLNFSENIRGKKSILARICLSQDFEK